MGSENLQKLLLESTISEEELKEKLDKINQSIKIAIEKRRRDNQELLNAAKPKEELIISLNCHILSATEFYKDIDLRIESEFRAGASIPTYNTGQQTTLELMVDCYKYPELKTILFFGNPGLETDDHIKAYVFLGEAKYLTDAADIFDFSDNPMFSKEAKMGDPLYILREVKEKEQALKIEKVRGQRILKTYIDSSFKFP